MPLHLETEVQTSSGNYEVALALDNTGSMAEHNKIGALKHRRQPPDRPPLFQEAGSEDRVKMALVPFTTAVNIRGKAFNPSWLDPKGLGLGSHRLDSYDREVSRLDIFAALSNGASRLRRPADGVEGLRRGARRRPRRRRRGARKRCRHPLDALPLAGRRRPGHGAQGPRLRDAELLSERPDGRQRHGARAAAQRRQVFQADRRRFFDPFDDDAGPNQSCRGPIVELTNDQKRMRDAINAMQPGGYTHIPQGLAWGWRVLSPGEPFTQGARL